MADLPELSGVASGDDRTDRRLTSFRRALWVVCIPALIAGSIFWQSPGTAIASPVLRAVFAYGLILVVLRLAGKRTLGEMSTFDLVILLIISEAVQPAMTGEDTSFTSAALIVFSLVAMDTLLGLAKHRSPAVSAFVEDVPTVLVREGRPVNAALERMRIDITDIMEAARLQHGMQHFSQVRFAVLERSGGISIIPRTDAFRDAASEPASERDSD